MGGKFYIYEHWRPDRDECFYVGKGHGRRASDMRRGRNRFHKFIQAKLSRAGSSVEVRIIAEGLDEQTAFALEIERIAFWRTDGADLANLTDGGEGSSGIKHTEEQKRTVSEKLKGRAVSDETRRKLSLANMGHTRGRGRVTPPEVIEKIRASNLGKKRSAETRKKMSAVRKGKLAHMPTTEEVERARLKQLGRPKSGETKAKMRKPKSEEHKRKISSALLGKKHSPETRAKLSASATAGWLNRRANILMEK